MISLFELFKIGIGPSSSHTVGPMLATSRFAQTLLKHKLLTQVSRVQIELFGSLALTGIGHATDRAVVLGLEDNIPSTIDPVIIEPRFAEIRAQHRLLLSGQHEIAFELERDLIFHFDKVLPRHPNGIRVTAFDQEDSLKFQRQYYSVGGGFVVADDEEDAAKSYSDVDMPHPFTSCDELLAICQHYNSSMADVVQQNELAINSPIEIEDRLDAIWQTMNDCIERGAHTQGILPGGLKIKRRAPELLIRLQSKQSSAAQANDPLLQMDWVTMFALAVNEENAAGGRVVTAPTNGAAGVIPAVLAYYDRFMPGSSRAGRHLFLKTAGAIGMLYKRNASLSAAEMGCQGEVGVACSMAAAGLAAVLGGTPRQVENAAEIGMEHNLGLTCDPVAGLVQIPCIERNTMGAIKAINAARLAVLYGDGTHRVSLDKVIETMRQTGVDMQTKYKETSQGGLAVNVINC